MHLVPLILYYLYRHYSYDDDPAAYKSRLMNDISMASYLFQSFMFEDRLSLEITKTMDSEDPSARK